MAARDVENTITVEMRTAGQYCGTDEDKEGEGRRKEGGKKNDGGQIKRRGHPIRL